MTRDEELAAIARFAAERGVTRCPPSDDDGLALTALRRLARGMNRRSAEQRERARRGYTKRKPPPRNA